MPNQGRGRGGIKDIKGKKAHEGIPQRYLKAAKGTLVSRIFSHIALALRQQLNRGQGGGFEWKRR